MKSIFKAKASHIHTAIANAQCAISRRDDSDLLLGVNICLFVQEGKVYAVNQGSMASAIYPIFSAQVEKDMHDCLIVIDTLFAKKSADKFLKPINEVAEKGNDIALAFSEKKKQVVVSIGRNRYASSAVLVGDDAIGNHRLLYTHCEMLVQEYEKGIGVLSSDDQVASLNSLWYREVLDTLHTTAKDVSELQAIDGIFFYDHGVIAFGSGQRYATYVKNPDESKVTPSVNCPQRLERKVVPNVRSFVDQASLDSRMCYLVSNGKELLVTDNGGLLIGKMFKSDIGIPDTVWVTQSPSVTMVVDGMSVVINTPKGYYSQEDPRMTIKIKEMGSEVDFCVKHIDMARSVEYTMNPLIEGNASALEDRGGVNVSLKDLGKLPDLKGDSHEISFWEGSKAVRFRDSNCGKFSEIEYVESYLMPMHPGV